MDLAEKPQQLHVIECDRQMSVVRFSPCGRWMVAGGYDATLRRWEMAGDEPAELPALKLHHGWVTAIEFQPVTKPPGQGGSSDPVQLLSADSWGQLRATRFGEQPEQVWTRPEAHDGWIRALSLSGDGKLVATAGRDRAARLWSTADGQPVAEFADHPHEVYAVAISPDRGQVVTGDLHGVLRCWDRESGRCAFEQKIDKLHLDERIQDVGGLRLLAFQDERTLICAGAEPQRAGRSIAIPTVHWLDWPSLEVRRTARFGPEKHGFVFDVAWHPAGFHVIVSSGQPGNGQLLLLKPDEDEPFFATTEMFNCHSAAVHPDGRFVVAASNRKSQGNGAVKDDAGNYLGNWSPLYLFAAPGEAKGA